MTAHPRRAGLTPGRWVKARRSDSASSCVEVRVDDGVYRVRDTKNMGRGPVLTLPPADWSALCNALLTIPTPLDQLVDIADVQLTFHPDGQLTMRRISDNAQLRFTPLEVDCFLHGLRGGEFDAPSPPLTGPAR